MGGRFSILSPVGLLLCEFLGFDCKKMLKGASDLRNIIFDADNFILKYAVNKFVEYKDYNKTNSVLMPYSSRLKNFSNWYCQLWAESLGKQFDLNNKVINTGQTPLSAVGANDQHSTVQLFMEGPNDKYFTFIQIEESEKQYTIENPFQYISQFNIYHNQPLHLLLNYELQATAYALHKQNRPISILSVFLVLDEYYLGQLFYFFQIANCLF